MKIETCLHRGFLHLKTVVMFVYLLSEINSSHLCKTVLTYHFVDQFTLAIESKESSAIKKLRVEWQTSIKLPIVG